MIRKNQQRIWQFLLFISCGMSISLLIPILTTPLPYHEVGVRMQGERIGDGYTWFAYYSQTAGPILEFRNSPQAVWYTVWFCIQLVIVAIGYFLYSRQLVEINRGMV